MKKKYLFSVIAAGLLSLSSCSGFLDQDPDTIITNDQLYSDPVLIKSALAKLYGDITFGQRLDAPEDYTFWMNLFAIGVKNAKTKDVIGGYNTIMIWLER